MNALRAPHYALMIATLAIGLAADVHTGFIGQMLISVVVWAVLFYLLGQVDLHERRAAFACLAIATIGEIVLSLGWGLYTYRLDNIPHFVPPGHVLMLLLGVGLARRMPDQLAMAILGGATIYAVGAGIAGLDTFASVLLILLLALAIAFPQHRRLYASTFLLSLVLELYGTWLGNWTWMQAVPKLRLVTTNPPALAGVFYATLDACVLAAMLVLARRFNRQTAGAGAFRAAGQSL